MTTMLTEPFDPNTVAPSTGSAGQLPVSGPDGYGVIITSSEMKPTNDGTGSMLVLSLQVTDGQHAGATGVYRFNLANNNLQTVQIARAQLSAVCYAVGHLQSVQDVSVLHNKPFRAIVGIQKGKEVEGYTEVKSVQCPDGSKPGEQPAAGAIPGAVAAPAAVAAPPAQAAPTTIAPPPAQVAPPTQVAAPGPVIASGIPMPTAAPQPAPAAGGFPVAPPVAAPVTAVPPVAAPVAALAPPVTVAPQVLPAGAVPWAQ